MDISNMKDGDVAGLGALQENYGYVAVKMSGISKSVVMVNGRSDPPEEVESIPLTQNIIYLQIACDYKYKRDRAYFYYSLDGTTWNRIGNTLQMSYTLSHFMGYRFALFNYATESTGGYVDFDYFRVYDSLDAPSAIDNVNESIPTGFNIYENYPNPFNLTTQIRYDVSMPSNVCINVYDITGRYVRTIVNDENVPGYYNVTFDASHMASGIYFYTLRIKDFIQTKKMIIMK